MTEDEFFVQLRESAEKLAHLTWELDGFSDGDDYVRLSLFGNDEKSLVVADLINDIDHAHYLNAARPSTVLALIGRVQAAEATVQRVRDAIKDAPTSDPTSGRTGPPDDWPDDGELIGQGEFLVAEQVRRALDGGEQE
ncbi:hypothetical protein [Glutamicibacter creatinolyticus]|uniref:hypothetical protein n=1 Tax=Glutamicibacter creatinolyticus TaxID=162496 RepID=UPI003216F8D1